MQASRKSTTGNLELSRLTLASLAVWLAVTCLLASDHMIPASSGTATAAATLAVPAASPSATPPAAAIAVAAMEERDEPEPRAEPASVEVALVRDEVAANVSVPVVVQTAAVAAVVNAADTAARFVFSADVGGQLLASKLTPPARFEVWAIPFVSEPKPWRTLRIDPLPRVIAPLTRTIIPTEPQTIPRTAVAGLSLCPLDLPSLPREIALSVPTPIVVLPQPFSFVPSPNADKVPFLAVSVAPPKEKIDVATDPARPATGVALFQARLLAAQLPTPFLKLAIPEPFEQIRTVQLNYKLPDLDPALFPAGRPSQPHFPVIELPPEPKK